MLKTHALVSNLILTLLKYKIIQIKNIFFQDKVCHFYFKGYFDVLELKGNTKSFF